MNYGDSTKNWYKNWFVSCRCSLKPIHWQWGQVIFLDVLNFWMGMDYYLDLKARDGLWWLGTKIKQKRWVQLQVLTIFVQSSTGIPSDFKSICSVVSKNFETDSDILSHGTIIVMFVYFCRIQRHVKFLVFLSSQNGFVDLKKSGKSTVNFLSIFSKKLPFGVNVFVTCSDKALRS